MIGTSNDLSSTVSQLRSLSQIAVRAAAAPGWEG